MKSPVRFTGSGGTGCFEHPARLTTTQPDERYAPWLHARLAPLRPASPGWTLRLAITCTAPRSRSWRRSSGDPNGSPAAERPTSAAALNAPRGDFEGKRFRCVHRARTDDYQLTFYYVGAEREAREQEWLTSSEQRRRLAEATAAEKRRLADLPADHEAYRALMTSMAESIAMEVRTLAGRGLGGYRYSDEAMEDVGRALDALADALALGRTEFSPAWKRATVSSLRAETAKANAGLQAFIALVTAGTKG